ncbi:MAG TPA: FtsL-like putative cell division protein [Adhaeribacter sp.]|nr:FtsL-like putative cell division protein [Adhaeribacter sp.]
MAINTLKPKPKAAPRANTMRAPKPQAREKAPRQKGTSIFELVERYTKMDSFFRDGLPVKYLPHVLFSMFIVLFYIGNTHFADKTIRKIDRTKVETEDLRADYTTLKSDYMEASKQSEVARKVAPMGLEESKRPPYQVIVAADEY